MRIPLIGFVGKSPYSISGISNDGGFCLEIYNKQKNTSLMLATKNYWNEYNKPANEKHVNLNLILMYLAVLITVIISVSLTTMNLLALNHKEPMGYLELYIRIFLQPIAYYAIIFYTLRWIEGIIFLSFFKDFRQWHACEHKSIVLLKAELEPTVENLKSCPMTLMNCGVVIGGTVLMAFNVLLGFMAINNLFSPEAEIALITIELTIFTSYLFFRVTISAQIEKLSLIYPILALPAAALPLLAQKLLTLKEPSDEKLAQTAAELKRFVEFNTSFFENPD